MTMGHFATALIPWGRQVRAPAWLLLLCAQLLDFVWFGLALAGPERVAPESFLDVTIVGLRSDMPYSHGGVGALVLAVVAAALVQLAWRDRTLSLWCGALVFGHWVCDLVCGFPHELLVAGTPMVGLGLYLTNPPLSFALEAAFSAGLVAWFLAARQAQGHPLELRAKVALLVVFVGGCAAFLPTSYTSFRQWLGL